MRRSPPGSSSRTGRTPLGSLAAAVSCAALLAACALLGACNAGPCGKIVRAEDGLTIACEVRGRGDIALVFLHGWCGTRAYWRNQVDDFAADYRVVTLDLPGHGESGKDRERWSVEGLAGDVESVVKALGLKRVILVGHSMGGPVALMAANKSGGKVIAVIAVDTLQNAESMPAADVRQKLVTDFTTNFTGSLRAMYPALLHPPADPELEQWLAGTAMAQDPKMALALFRDLTALDLKRLLAEARVPVRCINSGGGYAYFMPTAVEINRKYADFDAVFIAEVGHYPMLEKPAEFNGKLRDVLKEFRANP